MLNFRRIYLISEAILIEFSKWLHTRTGGQKTPKEAKKNACHISTIFDAIKLVNLAKLGSLETANKVEECFINPKMKVSQASTVKNHLLSLRKFCEYLMLQEVSYFDSSQYERIMKQIRLWNTSLTKDIKIRAIEKNAKDQCKYIKLCAWRGNSQFLFNLNQDENIQKYVCHSGLGILLVN